MRIGVIGWYGHANAGDERILHCLKRFFSDHELVVTSAYDDSFRRIDELNRCDCVLFGGGGLILRGFGQHAELFERIDRPIVCAGISAEAVHADNQALFQVLERKSEFILVRDEASRAAFRSDKVVVGPDLSFLYPMDVGSAVDADTCGLNLRPWPYWTFEYFGTAHRWMERVHERWPWLEKGYFLPKWKPERALDLVRDSFGEVRAVPLYTKAGVQNDVNYLQSLLPAVPEHFEASDMRACRYMIGMRLHSLIFACQMGIPFISLSYQPKNFGFCQSIGMERFSIDLAHVEKLPAAIAELKGSWPQVRQLLIEHRNENRNRIHDILSRLWSGTFQPRVPVLHALNRNG